MITFLKRPFWFGFPMYTWIGAGAAVLIAGVIFWRNRGGASASSNIMANVPSTNSPSPTPNYPFPSDSSGVNTTAPPPPIGASFPSTQPSSGIVPATPNASSTSTQVPVTNPGGYVLGSPSRPIVTPTQVQTSGTVLGGSPRVVVPAPRGGTSPAVNITRLRPPPGAVAVPTPTPPPVPIMNPVARQRPVAI